MKRSRIGMISAIALMTASQAQAAYFDRSHAIFFPPRMGALVTASQAFPAFWWNFLIYQGTGSPTDWEIARQTCTELKALPKELILRAECEQNLKELMPFLSDWMSDQSLRTMRPDDHALKAKFTSALAAASLPSDGPDAQSFFELLRADPLQSWKELKARVESKVTLGLPLVRGYFYDSGTQRFVIPIQMAFDPSTTAKTRDVLGRIAEPNAWTLIGPHGSTLFNESRITKDMHAVSAVGAVTALLFGLVLFFLRRGRLFLLFPVVVLSTAISAALTVLIFGSIHGLTLSFGSGIIGLALDYGFQGTLNRRAAPIWKTNLWGLLTTVVGLVVLMTSSVPLLRQMMAFSAIGLSTAFLLFYLLLTRHSSFFVVRPFPWSSRPRWPGAKALVCALLGGFAVIGLTTLRPNLDMRQFDFQDERIRPLVSWFYGLNPRRPPLFAIHSSEDALVRAHSERRFAEGAGLSLENAAYYLPTVPDQERNLATWRGDCPPSGTSGRFAPDDLRFFAPFFASSFCRARTADDLGAMSNGVRVPRYLQHLFSRDGQTGRWLSLWLPKSESEEKQIRNAYPEAVSLREVISVFPETLGRELRWMGPLSFFLATALLMIYYRNARWALIALIPFFTGVGLVTLAKLALGLEFSFISVIALVMVFGFSLDYGIFATDVARTPESRSPEGVWTAIGLAATTTTAGFVPFLFCQHPVLKHLGEALFFGAVGTYIGTIWGIPAAAKWRRT